MKRRLYIKRSDELDYGKGMIGTLVGGAIAFVFMVKYMQIPSGLSGVQTALFVLGCMTLLTLFVVGCAYLTMWLMRDKYIEM